MRMAVFNAETTKLSVVLFALLAIHAAAQAAQQQAECKLLLQGNGRRSSRAGLASASLSCSSAGGPIPIAVNSTYLQEYASSFTGVNIVKDLDCQTLTSSFGTPTYALFYFCGNYQITLTEPLVQDILLVSAINQGDIPTYETAVLAFGGRVTAVIQSGRLLNNSAGDVLLLVQQASVTLKDSVIESSSGWVGTGAWVTGTSSFTVDSSSFSYLSSTGNGSAIGAAESATVSITNSTFKGNRAFYNGAAIYVDGGVSITVKDSNITHNVAREGSGAGVYAVTRAKVTISSSIFEHNRAGWGAGVHLQGDTTASIDRSQFNHNVAVGTGGGIYEDVSGNVALSGCSFNTNVAESGGALALWGTANVSIKDSTFTHNKCNEYGGGLLVANEAQGVVEGSTFYNNSATWGGGVFLKEYANLEIRGCTFNTSYSTASGAALCAEHFAKMSIESSLFFNNTAASNGPAIAGYGNSTWALSSSTYQHNRALEYGGVVYLSDATKLSAQDCSFEHNRAGDSGGVVYASATSTQFRNCTFRNNTAAYAGGIGVYDDTALDVTSCTFDNNTVQTNGGGMVVAGRSQANIASTTFKSNKAGAYGGVVMATDTSTTNYQDCIFQNNTADSIGGVAVYINARVTITHCSALDNEAKQYGGGVGADNNAQVEISESNFTANRAYQGGGVVAWGDAAFSIRTSAFLNNHADYGGALYFGQNTKADLWSLKVLSNTATNGGGLHTSGTAVVTFHKPAAQTGPAAQTSVFQENVALDSGGGLYTMESAQLILQPGSCSIYYNTAHQYGGGICALSPFFSPAALTAAVSNNNARFDRDVAVRTTNLQLLTDTHISNYVDKVGTDEGILTVKLNVSGYYGLPSQGMLVSALLDGIEPLATSSSNAKGIVSMLLRVREPPGQYIISFTLGANSPDVPAANLSLQVRSCVKGEVTPSPDTCQGCLAGTYSLDPKLTECEECPDDANCPGGASIIPLVGYWHSSADSVQIHRCPNPVACQGGRLQLQTCSADATCRTNGSYPNLQCSASYEGNVCGVCADGFGASKPFNCRPCMSPFAIIGLYIAGAVLMLLCIKLLSHLTHLDNVHNYLEENATRPSELVRSLVLYSQRLLLVAALNIDWPLTFAWPVKVLAWVWSTATAEALSIDCFMPNSQGLPVAIQRVVFYLCTPVIMLILLWLFDAVVSTVQHKSAPKISDRIAGNAIVVVFFFLPSMLRTAFELFACIPLDEAASPPYGANAVGTFWVYDLGTQCYSSYHKALSAGLGLPLVILLCIGLPAVILYLTIKHRSQLDDPFFRLNCGFITRNYLPSKCWWEAVITFETIVLVAISVFGVNVGPFYQCILMIAALGLIMPVSITCKPYALPATERAMLHGTYCLYITALVGLSFLSYGSIKINSTYGFIMGLFLVFLNVAYVASVLWQLFKMIEWDWVAGVVHKGSSQVRAAIDTARLEMAGLANLGIAEEGRNESLLGHA